MDLLEEYNDARKRFLTALKRYQEFDAVGLRSPSLDYGGRTHKKHDLSDPVVKKMELLEDYARKGRRYLELYEELREKICSSGLETDEEIVLLRRLLLPPGSGLFLSRRFGGLFRSLRLACFHVGNRFFAVLFHHGINQPRLAQRGNTLHSAPFCNVPECRELQ